MPEPSTVRVPEPLPITPDSVMLPAPPNVRLLEPLVRPPERVRVPASELIRVSPVSVMAPAKLLLPLRLCSAPPDDIPDPLSVSALLPTLMPPLKRSSAPLATEIEPAVVPSAAELRISIDPPLMVVLPVKLLALLMMTAPAPVLSMPVPPVMAPVPLMV